MTVPWLWKPKRNQRSKGDAGCTSEKKWNAAQHINTPSYDRG
jgi:hypothetical protein